MQTKLIDSSVFAADKAENETKAIYTCNNGPRNASIQKSNSEGAGIR